MPGLVPLCEIWPEHSQPILRLLEPAPAESTYYK